MNTFNQESPFQKLNTFGQRLNTGMNNMGQGISNFGQGISNMGQKMNWNRPWDQNGQNWNGQDWDRNWNQNGQNWNGQNWNGQNWNGQNWNGQNWNGQNWNGQNWNQNGQQNLVLGYLQGNNGYSITTGKNQTPIELGLSNIFQLNAGRIWTPGRKFLVTILNKTTGKQEKVNGTLGNSYGVFIFDNLKPDMTYAIDFKNQVPVYSY